ncbi:XRE family transcriptional regulator [Staphylococcus devriesei]|uniref:XRE family transcriptional regulator n=1 Tax=Staphylococcus devriesei TaxID=586733 RepID=A0A2K4DUV9_9STAP|nr:helix-turn-helix transcriptional regulator [Staphylococcus devriesei]MCE5090509.1 helix-turn-helix transcriptional regulator [Staphylococcus devriesei]MCE5096636.1 helix-turn-helix transcriptional regulator [Staphylococcus devriesei]PNZ90579.1 hypothetical protein CD147_00150 [Staphylococcus devriesei]PTE73900.1 XRE family transcriptional regulator [Staphylococcus devriesei]PTF03412.1 XRE family transcriptional regulator [Staphylococcus devriesei]
MRTQKNVGNIIRKIRIISGLDQKTFAKRINTTVSALSNWENGRNYPKEDYLVRINREFNIPIDFILYETHERVFKVIELLKNDINFEKKYKFLYNEEINANIIEIVTNEINDFSNQLGKGTSIYIPDDSDIYDLVKKELSKYDKLSKYEHFDDNEAIVFISEHLSTFIKENSTTLKENDISNDLVNYIEKILYKALHDIQEYNNQ